MIALSTNGNFAIDLGCEWRGPTSADTADRGVILAGRRVMLLAVPHGREWAIAEHKIVRWALDAQRIVVPCRIPRGETPMIDQLVSRLMRQLRGESIEALNEAPGPSPHHGGVAGRVIPYADRLYSLLASAVKPAPLPVW